MKNLEALTSNQIQDSRLKMERLEEQKAGQKVVQKAKQERSKYIESSQVSPIKVLEEYENSLLNYQKSLPQKTPQEGQLKILDINFLNNRIPTFFQDFVADFPKATVISSNNKVASGDIPLMTEEQKKDQKLPLGKQQLDFVLDYYEDLLLSYCWKKNEGGINLGTNIPWTPKLFDLGKTKELKLPIFVSELAGLDFEGLTNAELATIIRETYTELEKKAMFKVLAKKSGDKSLTEFRIQFNLKKQVQDKIYKLAVDKEFKEKKAKIEAGQKQQKEDEERLKLEEFTTFVENELEKFKNDLFPALGLIYKLWDKSAEIFAKALIKDGKNEFKSEDLYTSIAINFYYLGRNIPPNDKTTIINFLLENIPESEDKEKQRQNLRKTLGIESPGEAYTPQKLGELIQQKVAAITEEVREN